MKRHKLRELDRTRIDFKEPYRPTALIITKYEHRRGAILSQVKSVLEFLRVPFECRCSSWYYNDLGVEKLHEVIIFVNIESYSTMNEDAKATIMKYCKTHDIGIIIMHWATNNTRATDIVPVAVEAIHNVTQTKIDPSNPMWRITKDGGSNVDGLNNTKFGWAKYGIQADPSYYTPFMYASSLKDKKERHVVGFTDNGKRDGIRKIVMGNILDYWLHHCVFMDALQHASSGAISIPLKRTVNVDIDDVFLGIFDEKKITESDVRVGTKSPFVFYILNCTHMYVNIFKSQIHLTYIAFYFQNYHVIREIYVNSIFSYFEKRLHNIFF